MAERKVIKFLQTLSKKELTKFNQYLRSPYFNQSEELCTIYGHLKDFILNKKKEYSFDEVIQNKFSAENKSISKINLDKYLSRIYNFLLDFIAMEQFRNNSFAKNSKLMEYLTENDALKLFDKIYKKTKTDLDKEKISFQNYLNCFLLERSKTNYLSVHAIERKGDQNLRQTDNALDDFYLVQKFNLTLIKIFRQKSTNEKFKYRYIDSLFNCIDKNQLDKNELLNFLYEIYKIIDNSQMGNFEMLCNVFNNSAKKLDETIAYNFGSIIRNQARIIYKDDNEYFQFIFKFNKAHLDSKIIFYKGKLFATVFKNIVDVALRLNELEWSEKFIDKNWDKIIPKEHATDIINYCKARLSFFRGEYEKTRDFINTLNFNDIYNKMDLKRLEIMVYFELKEYTLLEYLINSFRVSLTPQRSQNLSETQRNWNKQFVTFALKILKFYISVNLADVNEIRQAKSDLIKKNVSNKLWLSSKLDYLLDNH